MNRTKRTRDLMLWWCQGRNEAGAIGGGGEDHSDRGFSVMETTCR